MRLLEGGRAKPRLLDLFSGAGGAGMGYHRAGFEVVGVDNRPQPRYPFEFHQADAFDVLDDLINPDPHPGDMPYPHFDAIHASPPCQDHSPLRSVAGEHGTGWLLAATRDALKATGLPYVIENVEAAAMPGSLVLCGTEFGLEHEGRWLRRHRRFESNVFLLGAGGCQCNRPDSPTGVYGDLSLNDRPVRYSKRGDVMNRAGVATARALLGCPWMNAAELSQAIPPAYCQFIGEQLLFWLRGGADGLADSSPEHTPDTFACPDRSRGSLPSTDGPAGSESSARSIPAEFAANGAHSRQSAQHPGAPDSRRLG